MLVFYGKKSAHYTRVNTVVPEQGDDVLHLIMLSFSERSSVDEVERLFHIFHLQEVAMQSFKNGSCHKHVYCDILSGPNFPTVCPN